MSRSSNPSSSGGRNTGTVPRVRLPYDRHQVPAELLRPHHPRHGRARQNQQGMCSICSYNQDAHEPKVPVYHRHFSSYRLREMTGAEAENKRYLCPSCKSFHLPYPDPENRVKIVVSDSTLHEFFAPSASCTVRYSDQVHTDYITISGASIKALTLAYKLDYFDQPPSRPVDVVMVGGYNDLVAGKNRNTIMDDLRAFTTMVKLTGLGLHQEQTNSVAVSTFMYAPQLSWFPDNGPYPYPGYQDQKEKIDWLNGAVNALNIENNAPMYPAFHTYGVRTNTMQQVDMLGNVTTTRVKVHRWEHWREQDKGNMLHLRDDRRLKMAAAVNKYFAHNT